MQDFASLTATFTDLKPMTRGGQKEVYSATHPAFGAIVIKLFFKTDARSQREIDINENVSLTGFPWRS